jgi:hypothetical protein
MRFAGQSIAVARVTVTAAAFVAGSCSVPNRVEQENVASPQKRFPSAWIFSCSPVNHDAGRFGPVVFETDFDVGMVVFKSPESWRTHVTIVPSSPQDPPERNLNWVTKNGRVLTGRIGWRDDATLNPDTFGVSLGKRDDRLRWAIWTCKAASSNVR